jgi:hypothetical protein
MPNTCPHPAKPCPLHVNTQHPALTVLLVEGRIQHRNLAGIVLGATKGKAGGLIGGQVVLHAPALAVNAGQGQVCHRLGQAAALQAAPQAVDGKRVNRYPLLGGA